MERVIKMFLYSSLVYMLLCVFVNMWGCEGSLFDEVGAEKKEQKALDDWSGEYTEGVLSGGLELCDTINYPCNFQTIQFVQKKYDNIERGYIVNIEDGSEVMFFSDGVIINNPFTLIDNLNSDYCNSDILYINDKIRYEADTLYLEGCLIREQDTCNFLGGIKLVTDEGGIKLISFYYYPCALYAVGNVITDTLVSGFIGVKEISFYNTDSAQAAEAIEVLIDSCATGVNLLMQGTPIDTTQLNQLDSLFNTVVQ